MKKSLYQELIDTNSKNNIIFPTGDQVIVPEFPKKAYGIYSSKGLEERQNCLNKFLKFFLYSSALHVDSKYPVEVVNLLLDFLEVKHASIRDCYELLNLMILFIALPAFT